MGVAVDVESEEEVDDEEEDVALWRMPAGQKTKWPLHDDAVQTGEDRACTILGQHHQHGDTPHPNSHAPIPVHLHPIHCVHSVIPMQQAHVPIHAIVCLSHRHHRIHPDLDSGQCPPTAHDRFRRARGCVRRDADSEVKVEDDDDDDDDCDRVDENSRHGHGYWVSKLLLPLLLSHKRMMDARGSCVKVSGGESHEQSMMMGEAHDVDELVNDEMARKMQEVGQE